MENLVIAKIVKPQGIRGEVKAKLLIDDYACIKKGKSYYLGENLSPIIIDSFYIKEGFLYAKFNITNSRNEAEVLRGKNIYQSKIELKKDIVGDQIFISDILGYEIIVDKKLIGKLVDIKNFGSADVYYVDAINGKQILFPNVKGLIENIDNNSKQIVLNSKRFEEVAVV